MACARRRACSPCCSLVSAVTAPHTAALAAAGAHASAAPGKGRRLCCRDPSKNPHISGTARPEARAGGEASQAGGRVVSRRVVLCRVVLRLVCDVRCRRRLSASEGRRKKTKKRDPDIWFSAAHRPRQNFVWQFVVLALHPVRGVRRTFAQCSWRSSQFVVGGRRCCSASRKPGFCKCVVLPPPPSGR